MRWLAASSSFCLVELVGGFDPRLQFKLSRAEQRNPGTNGLESHAELELAEVSSSNRYTGMYSSPRAAKPGEINQAGLGNEVL